MEGGLDAFAFLKVLLLDRWLFLFFIRVCVGIAVDTWMICIYFDVFGLMNLVDAWVV